MADTAPSPQNGSTMTAWARARVSSLPVPAQGALLARFFPAILLGPMIARTLARKTPDAVRD